jgi:uncharacterized protein (TIGR03435 family)
MNENNIDEVLRHALPSASEEQREAARERIYTHALTAVPLKDAAEDLSAAPVSKRSLSLVFAFSAVAALAVVLAIPFVRSLVSPDKVYAIVETGSLVRVVNGKMVPVSVGEKIALGTAVRTEGAAGAVLKLPDDGSRVEMRPTSELMLEAADDGLRIRLNTGNIIVTAAKQRDGHLYVQTKEMTVSVVGTLFLVNAEEGGSRVAVIEGEVRVQHGSTEKTLLPGEQLATNPAMEKSPVRAEISWGQNAEVILPGQRSAGLGRGATQEPPETFEAVLASLEVVSEARQMLARVRQSSSSLAAPPQKAPEEFDVASIRRTIATQTEGGGRIGGGNTSGFASNGPGDPCTSNRRFQVYPGRLIVSGGTLYGLIAMAYTNRCLPDLPFGGPEWAKTDQYDVQALIPAGTPIYTTQDLIDGNAPELQKMLQSLLADRFKLKLRLEMKEMPAYNMVVGDPEKLKRWSLTDIADRKGPPRATVFTTYAAPGTLKAWAKGIDVGRPVIDKTGLTGLYEFTLEYPSATRVPRGLNDLKTALEEMHSLLPKAMESQLGLKLEPTMAPVQVIAIEYVERPSEN